MFDLLEEHADAIAEALAQDERLRGWLAARARVEDSAIKRWWQWFGDRFGWKLQTYRGGYVAEFRAKGGDIVRITDRVRAEIEEKM